MEHRVFERSSHNYRKVQGELVNSTQCRLVPACTRHAAGCLSLIPTQLHSLILRRRPTKPTTIPHFSRHQTTKDKEEQFFFFLNLSSRFSWVTSPFHAKIICFPFNLSRFKCGNSWRNKRVKCNNRRWLLTCEQCEGRCKKLTTSGNPAPY